MRGAKQRVGIPAGSRGAAEGGGGMRTMHRNLVKEEEMMSANRNRSRAAANGRGGQHHIVGIDIADVLENGTATSADLPSFSPAELMAMRASRYAPPRPMRPECSRRRLKICHVNLLPQAIQRKALHVHVLRLCL